MKRFLTLFRNEVTLALRGGDMFFFGVIFPAGVMILVGFISSSEAIRLGFAGIATIGICATGLMGIPLSFAGYRHGKILKRFQVTPVSPLILLLANTLMQCLFTFISAAAVYLIARFGFGMVMTGSFLRFVLTFLFVQFAIYSLGFLIAALVPDTKTTNLVCTLAYFPMLFLSGSTVPTEIMPKGLQVFTEVFPLTQGIKLLKGAVLGLELAPDLPRMLLLAGIAVVSYAIALKTFRWE